MPLPGNELMAFSGFIKARERPGGQKKKEKDRTHKTQQGEGNTQNTTGERTGEKSRGTTGKKTKKKGTKDRERKRERRNPENQRENKQQQKQRKKVASGSQHATIIHFVSNSV
jgi:hypothetical protein